MNKLRLQYFQFLTRMHSSRVRTGRSLTVRRSLLPGGGVYLVQGGVSDPGGLYLVPGGVLNPRGV